MALKKKSLIQLADEQVDIFLVYNQLGMYVTPVYDVKSVKTYCPFGEIAHVDQGRDPAFRIYPYDNTAYCFACREFFSPVRLLCKARDLTPTEAAEQLLDKIGYKPLTLEEMWERVQAPEEKRDVASLAQALQMFCETTDPQWTLRQFDPRVAKVLDDCLALLSFVHTDDDAENWLTTTKRVMQGVLKS